MDKCHTVLDEVADQWPGFRVCQSFHLNHDWRVKPYRSPAIANIESIVPFNVPVGKTQETAIQTLVEKGQRLLRIVDSLRPHWDFVEIAMGYIGKAALTKPDLEQLLWNITVLDCLLSEKAEATQSMRRRIGNILAETNQQRTQLRKNFDDLYDFRSDLVHGNRFRKKAQYHHLARARDLAREVMSWFIDYLLWIDTDFRQREISYEHYPRREELLYALDFDRSSLNRLNRLLEGCPPRFPSSNRENTLVNSSEEPVLL